MTLRRRLAGWMHRFAYWIDRQADKVWDVDEILDLAHPPTLIFRLEERQINAQDIYRAVADTEQRRLP